MHLDMSQYLLLLLLLRRTGVSALQVENSLSILVILKTTCGHVKFPLPWNRESWNSSTNAHNALVLASVHLWPWKKVDQFQCSKNATCSTMGLCFFFLKTHSPSGSRPLSALIASRSTSDGAPAAAAGLAVVHFLTDLITVFFGADPVCHKH